MQNRNRFGVVSLLILLYLVMCGAAVILDLAGRFGALRPISAEAIIFLILCFVLIFSGFTGFRDNKFTVITIHNIFLYKAFEYVLLAGGLLALVFFAPFALTSFVGDVATNRGNLQNHIAGLAEAGIVNSVFSMFANLFALAQIFAFINLIPVNGKRNVVKAYLLIFSSLSYVVYVLAYVGRDGVVFWIMTFIFAYFLLRDFLLARDVKIIRLVFLVLLGLLLIPFFIITVERFSGRIDSVTWQVVNYAGQQIANFSDRYQLDAPTLGGIQGFPVFRQFTDFLGFTESGGFSQARLADVYKDSGMRRWIFATFIGSWLIDFGKIGALTGVALMAVVVRKLLKRVGKDGVFNFSNLVLFVLFYQIVFYGVFYFRQTSANYYIIGMFVLSFYFRLGGDEKLYRRYRKRKHKSFPI